MFIREPIVLLDPGAFLDQFPSLVLTDLHRQP